jgi:hypothetical protein
MQQHQQNDRTSISGSFDRPDVGAEVRHWRKVAPGWSDDNRWEFAREFSGPFSMRFLPARAMAVSA